MKKMSLKDLKNFKKLNLNELKKIGAGTATDPSDPCDQTWTQWASSGLADIATGNFASYGVKVAMANACDELGN
ncbi:hypothetical protein [Flavobacterium sp. J27]|uniref:hypothetical protein n=1 Tax=Flavobacterium sp. J27 TaxID=2060419 RepID=UPI001030B99E|nr:hypothetical protein [Flavobacterium sp. J27]